MARISLYLDTRTTHNGTSQIKISISQHGSNAYIPTGVWIRPEQWSKERINGHSNKHTLQMTIDNLKARAQTTLIMMEQRAASMTATQIKQQIIRTLYPEQQQHENSIYNRIIIKANNSSTKRTKEIYLATAKRLLDFDHHATTRPLEEITKDYLTSFNTFLGGSINARAIHMRNLRAVFNDAIDNNITNHYPFRTFKIRTEATQKKALDVETLRHIIHAPLPKPLANHRDYFVLSFLLIGINISDLYDLNEITNGRIEYRRHKTGRLYSIKVEEEADQIIRAHKGSERLIDIADNFKTSRTFTAAHNRALKKIYPALTSYHARHTWATIAYEIGISTDIISQALGHSFSTGADVTQVYIRRDGRKVDDANRKVIEYVLKKG